MRLCVPAVAIISTGIFAAGSSAQEAPPLALRVQQSAAAEAICPMPVHVPATRTEMPVARPDTAIDAKILVVEPRCHNPLGPLAVKPLIVRPDAHRSTPARDAVRDALEKWWRLQPPDTSKRPPGR